MKFEKFQSGRWQPRYQYKSYEQILVNHKWSWEDFAMHYLLENPTGCWMGSTYKVKECYFVYS